MESLPIVGDQTSGLCGFSSGCFGFTLTVLFLPWYPGDPPAICLELSLTLPTIASRKTNRWFMATCSKTPAFTPSAYPKKMQFIVLGRVSP